MPCASLAVACATARVIIADSGSARLCARAGFSELRIRWQQFQFAEHCSRTSDKWVLYTTVVWYTCMLSPSGMHTLTHVPAQCRYGDLKLLLTCACQLVTLLASDASSTGCARFGNASAHATAHCAMLAVLTHLTRRPAVSDPLAARAYMSDRQRDATATCKRQQMQTQVARSTVQCELVQSVRPRTAHQLRCSKAVTA